MLVAIITQVLVIISFVVIGFLFLQGKGAFLIAGYNTMPKKEKEKFDEKALCQFMGKMMFLLAGSMTLWTIGQGLNILWLFWLGMIIFMAVVVFMLVYMNTGNRFKK